MILDKWKPAVDTIYEMDTEWVWNDEGEKEEYIECPQNALLVAAGNAEVFFPFPFVWFSLTQRRGRSTHPGCAVVDKGGMARTFDEQASRFYLRFRIL